MVQYIQNVKKYSTVKDVIYNGLITRVQYCIL